MADNLFFRNCKACNARLMFVRTRANKLMPCDVPPIEESVHTVEVESDGVVVVTTTRRLMNHWATCPEASRFKKGRS